jgi:serine/threonine protein phosphatase 1
MNATPGHTALFSALRHAAFTAERSLLFVHAAVDPARPLAAQRDAFWWGRHDILELAAPFEGFARVIRGIGRQPGVVERAFAVSLSGGQSGRLVAACFGSDGALRDVVEA